MKIEIGNKNLSHLTGEHIRQIVMIVGACPSREFWNDPVIIEFENDIFSDTLVLTYKSYRKEDNKESMEFQFYFQFKDFWWHVTKDYERLGNNAPTYHRNVDYKTIKYLISDGFDIPIY